MKLLRFLKLVATIRCERATQLASDALDRELSWDERFALRWHTIVCAPCRRMMQQLGTLRQTLARMPDGWRINVSDASTVRLSPERRAQIKRLLLDAQRLESG